MNRQEMRLFLDDIIHGLHLNEYLTKEQVKWQHGKSFMLREEADKLSFQLL